MRMSFGGFAAGNRSTAIANPAGLRGGVTKLHFCFGSTAPRRRLRCSRSPRDRNLRPHGWHPPVSARRDGRRQRRTDVGRRRRGGTAASKDATCVIASEVGNGTLVAGASNSILFRELSVMPKALSVAMQEVKKAFTTSTTPIVWFRRLQRQCSHNISGRRDGRPTPA